VARRLGSVRGRLAVGAALAFLVVVAIYWFGLRQETAEPNVRVPRLAATIGEGSEAVGVAADGSLVRWLPLPGEPPLPRLPLDEPPKNGRVKGSVLEQVRILAAVPDALRPYVEGSRYGGSGVVVELTTGVELRFGDDRQAARKWHAAAAVLADPEVTTLDYVDLQVPGRPSYGGAEHELPPAP
jgi:hypothetical protein